MTASADRSDIDIDELCDQHDPHAVDGRRAEGELGAPGHADGARAARLHALHARHAPQPGERRLAEPRPLRALVRATPRCCSTRSSTSAATAWSSRTSSASASSARRAPGTPSTARRPASRRRPGRSARASRRASGSRSPSACSPRASTAPGHADHRPPHVHDRLRRRPRGGRLSPRPRSLAGHLGLGRLIAFYDDNHISIEGDTELVLQRGRRRALRGLRLARAAPRRGHLAPDRLEEAARAAMAVEDRPSLIVCRTHIASGAPEQAGQRGRARLAARRGGDPRSPRSVYGWPRRAAVPRPGRGARALPRDDRARRARSSATGSARFAAYRERAPRARRRARGDLRAARAGARPPGRCTRFDAGDEDRDAQGLRGRARRSPPSSSRRWSAAPPTSRPRRSR